MRVDMVLLGLWIDRGGFSDDYRVYFEIRPLWFEDAKMISRSFIFIETHSENGIQCFIDLSKHERKFRKIIGYVINQFGLLIQENIRISDLYDILYKDLYRYGRFSGDFYMWLSVYELQLAIALYFDNSELMKETKAYIENEIGHWGRSFFENRIKMPVQQWLDDLYAKFSDRERFMEIIRENCARKKVSKLNQAHFICDLPVKTAGNGLFSRMLRALKA